MGASQADVDELLLRGGAANGRFASDAEEARFWKSRALELHGEVKAVKEEFQEFQEGSRELETELEAQLEQTEQKVKEYRSLSNRLQMEYDSTKSKLEQCHLEYNCRINDLQTQLTEITSIKDDLNKYVRDLEQQNDDLERVKRSTLASLEDFEARMNATIERNAFLESELDEKESLKVAVQRLKDETRDLRAELRVLAAPATPARAPPPGSVVNGIGGAATPTKRAFSLDSPINGSAIPTFSPAVVGSCEANNNVDSNKLANGNNNSAGGVPAPPLTPSARISALNIVGDLLRKVGALELKLSSCRNIVKENSGATSSGTGVSSGLVLGASRALSPHASSNHLAQSSSNPHFTFGTGVRSNTTPSTPSSSPGLTFPSSTPQQKLVLNPYVTDRSSRRVSSSAGSGTPSGYGSKVPNNGHLVGIGGPASGPPPVPVAGGSKRV